MPDIKKSLTYCNCLQYYAKINCNKGGRGILWGPILKIEFWGFKSFRY